MAKIVFFNVEDWEKPFLKKALEKHSTVFVDEDLTEENAAEYKDVEIASVFIYSDVNKKVLEKMPKLKLVTTMSTGFDHINLKACKQRGITVCNVPAYGVNTVAEHTFGLILTVSKKLHESIERTRKGDFRLEGLMGFDLQDKTLGVIGTGKIGGNVACIGAKGFGMNVIAYDPKPNKALAKKCGFAYVSFNELLKKSDIITIHCPLTPKTKHLINTKTLSKIKKGTVLINTARGRIVQTSAILEGLKKGVFSAVGLDVLEEECGIKEERELLHEAFRKKCDLKTLLEEHVLMGQPNAYITPHNAWYSKEAVQRILETTVKNIQSFLKNKPVNTVKA